MTGTLRVLRIPADLELDLEFVDIEASLDSLQEEVGGYIEFVQSRGMELMLNEEGKLVDLPPNERATMLWWAGQPAARGRDVIHGNVVVMGPVDLEGESTGLTFHHEVDLALFFLETIKESRERVMADTQGCLHDRALAFVGTKTEICPDCGALVPASDIDSTNGRS